MTTSYTEIGTDISRAAAIIKAGRVVAVPTGTSYGLAADALQGYALQRVRNVKQRPDEKTFTVFMADSLWSQHLLVTSAEAKVLRHFHNQPLTLLVQPQPSLQHLAQDNRVGLRVIDHPLMQALAVAAGVPLTATSANISGQAAAYDVASLQASFPGRLDDSTYDLSVGYILDGDQLEVKPATTIARIDGQTVTVIRPGPITEAAISKLLG